MSYRNQLGPLVFVNTEKGLLPVWLIGGCGVKGLFCLLSPYSFGIDVGLGGHC